MDLPTIILRHRRENLKKCSLRGLEKRSDMRFYSYPTSILPSMDNYVVLSMDGPLLSEKDSQFGLFIIDATWRYAEVMGRSVDASHPTLLRRSLPSELRTAYPRRQDDCVDPDRGLASVEALYAAYRLMERETDGLLDNYHWREEFLEKNSFLAH